MPRIADVKRSLLRGDEPSNVMTEFLVTMNSDLGLIDRSQPIQDQDLESILGVVATKTLGTEAELTDIQLSRLDEDSLIHGALAANGLICSVLFFEDHRAGVFAVVRSWGGEMSYARFGMIGTSERPELFTSAN